MKKFTTTACIMAVLFFIGVTASVNNPVWAQGRFGGHDGKGFLSDLTDQQRAAVQEKKEEMRSQGATREEIHATVAKMLQGFGVELPENWGEGRRGGHKGFLKGLTDQQRDAVHDRIQQMRDEGASPQEIHTAMAEMLEGYGIEVPEDCPGPMGPGRFGFQDNLTDEQREAIRSKTKEMRDQGVTREQIHAAIAGMLKGYGIDVPDDWHGPLSFGHPWGDFRADVTDEQRQALREKRDQLRAQGASREEIHAAIAGMLKDYGVELPGRPMKLRGSGAGPGRWAADLTGEQRQTVREKIHQMRGQGASREEIRAAVSEMLQQYGIRSPEVSEGASVGTAPAESNIVAGSHPNPFNPETQISYMLGASEDVRIQIFNVSGQLIRTYDLGYQPAGSHSVKWDGRNENGDMAASGVYLYRIQAGPYDVTNRMVLLK